MLAGAPGRDLIPGRPRRVGNKCVSSAVCCVSGLILVVEYLKLLVEAAGVEPATFY
jgi:hypothetical protein